MNAQGNNNYLYDLSGFLTSDESEGIPNIVWNAAGKVIEVIRDGKPNIYFKYDAYGNRLIKEIAGGDKTLYIRDLQGNIMATYVYPATVPDGEDQEFTLQEHHIYSSSRIGIVKSMPPNTIEENEQGEEIMNYQQYTSYTHYELSNHLGNVMATNTDHKTLVLDNGFFSHYEAVVVSATDYYPFGWGMPSRHIDSDLYRFGFNGKENDDEWGKQDFTARIYNGRVGRWLSMDPLQDNYPSVSPYVFGLNTPVYAFDQDGERVYFVAGAGNDQSGWNYVERWKEAFKKVGILNFIRVNKSRGKLDDVMFTSFNKNSVSSDKDFSYNFSGKQSSYRKFGTTFENTPDKLKPNIIGETVSFYEKDFELNPLEENEQLNLVGYSYGSVLQAQVAIKLAEKGHKIDNLVLIGSPISDE